MVVALAGCGRAPSAAPSTTLPLAADSAIGVPAVGHEAAALAPILAAQTERERRRLVAAQRRAKRVEMRRLNRSPTIDAALRHAWLAGRLGRAEYKSDREILLRARAAAAGLPGIEGAEQRAAYAIVRDLASQHRLSADRIRTAFIQLHRNTTWWARRGPPAYGQPLVQGHDPVTMKYVPGQGLVVHFLSSWGRVNALARDCSNKPKRCPRRRLRTAVERMLSLGSIRDGYLTWESLFNWDGGAPGWVSAITQGTALQALSRAASVLQSRSFERAGRRTLGAFEHPPPVGVSVPAYKGRHYLMYSFAPDVRILNGFLRALTGLRDFSRLTGSKKAFRLYKAGIDAAVHEVHKDDTGAWSLYSDGGEEASFGYHRLATGFLTDLCAITGRRDMCHEAARFSAYLVQPPAMRIVVTTRRPRARHNVRFALALSKISSLNVVVTTNGRTVLARQLTMPRGVARFRFLAPIGGKYTINAVAKGPSGPLGRSTVVVPVRSLARKGRHART